MFKHILVPLDGSRLAESALPSAAYMADKLASKVTLIHAIEHNAPQEVHGQPHLRSAREADLYLKEIGNRWFPDVRLLDCHVHTAEVADVARSIVDHSGELDYDLIVMCSHGRGKAMQLFMGSMAQTIIGLGTIPVLLVRPDATGAFPEFTCSTILVPLDTDPEHAQALPVAKELAGEFGAALHLSMVIELFTTLSGVRAVTSRLLPGTTSRLLEISASNGKKFVHRLLGELVDQGYNASAEVLRGDPAAVIVKSAQTNKADLVVLATHGKSGMEAFLAGSFSHKLCSLCTTPLLLLPVAGEPAQ
ncbi:universal stress protein [Desulfopila sp. IMCC35006]|uniref:universal stress protein n=1 Tax=Desulfopila sp. IMCC35006 TaxID=2569542 RepID=UPI0010ABF054|nr:universal stress protein [Desulfopila sp. IMCC35006]TKB26703.1 universal stress protein [Desulfopila sp. IMCC35006]